mgnify:CR=1 FL=1
MDYSIAIGRVVSHRDDSSRQLLAPGDLLRIDAGEDQGVTAGQNLVVRSRFQTGDLNAPKKLQTFGEQAGGLVQIMEAHRDSSLALIVYACGEIVAGDSVERYVPQPAFFAVSAGTPRYDEPARITLGENGRKTAAAGQMMVIDRGIMQGVQRGQRLTIFRRDQLLTHMHAFDDEAFMAGTTEHWGPAQHTARRAASTARSVRKRASGSATSTSGSPSFAISALRRSHIAPA